MRGLLAPAVMLALAVSTNCPAVARAETGLEITQASAAVREVSADSPTGQELHEAMLQFVRISPIWQTYGSNALEIERAYTVEDYAIVVSMEIDIKSIFYLVRSPSNGWQTKGSTQNMQPTVDHAVSSRIPEDHARALVAALQADCEPSRREQPTVAFRNPLAPFGSEATAMTEIPIVLDSTLQVPRF